MIPRERVNPLPALKTLTAPEHELLRKHGLSGKQAWAPGAEHECHPLVTRFKKEIKDYYFWHQGMRCCYCSSELQNSARSFDADHIVDKSTFPRFTFELKNLGVACVVCNTHKVKKSVLTDADPSKITDIPEASADYAIVHPHLDEWSAYLTFDQDGLVRSLKKDGKGARTIAVCGIEATNFTRLAGKFSGDTRQDAYKLMCAIISKKRKSLIVDMLAMLERLAGDTPGALAVVSGLRGVMNLA